MKFVVEITPKPTAPPPPTAQPKRYEAPVPAPRNTIDWNLVIGGGLIVTAGIIVVATIVEDFYTVGVGIGDDPASFSAAGAALARGLVMLGAAGEALPKASNGASVSVTSKVALQDGI